MRIRSKPFGVVFPAMLVAAAWLLQTPPVAAQDIPPGTIPDVGQQQPTGDAGTGGTGSVGAPLQQANQAGDAELQNLGDFINQFNLQPEEVEIENMRVQPFVGPSRAAFAEQGISHPRSQIDQSAGGAQIGGGRGFGFGGGAAASQPLEGFEVVRAGVRARLVPQIQVRYPVSAAMVTQRFQQRLGRIPSVNLAAGGVNVSVDNRVATLTGMVATAEQRGRIEALARLEPGISEIDNRIVVIGQ
jgi:hypothetical protein